ncbi:Chitin deacetylase [Choanephora cucurbitarum]|uniref:Chitin deacetylase n=1 Tax=Choanephora cucurbitarum TaxID=101091 RepID=A0A1C7N8W1_9FUNG|nr:Chitin deacetylase [Choanephora cucurbitarum]
MKVSILGAILLAMNGPLALAVPTRTISQLSTNTTTSYMPSNSPIFPELSKPTDVVSEYNYGPYNVSQSLPTYTLSGYPEVWKTPSTTSKEVQAAIAKIDWSLVPNAPVRKQKKDGSWVKSTDGPKDPYCWWSDTNCVTPKIKIPQDYYTCGRKGDWGLSYDDGPFNRYEDKNAKTENAYAEPALYNFLAKHNNQKATLFYIGSNVATYPAAAKRAFNDGHHICVHTWSHPVMTTKNNHEVVAELYWTLRAIKETLGVTPKCWRPPQGDVDDRVRAIAWQMGMRTVLWDEDTNDWNMSGAPDGGDLSPNVVDGYFKQWIADQEAGNQTTGHVVLEHELNHRTVNMTMFWLPTLQKKFNVLPALACNNVTQPYWEEQYVYPIKNMAVNSSTPTSSNSTSNGSAAKTTDIVLSATTVALAS